MAKPKPVWIEVWRVVRQGVRDGVDTEALYQTRHEVESRVSNWVLFKAQEICNETRDTLEETFRGKA